MKTTDNNMILNEIKSYKNFTTDVDLASFLGISRQNLSAWRNRNSINVNLIVDKIPELSRSWLLTGEGNMLTENNETNEDYLVPLLPVYAQCGTFSSYGDCISLAECEKIISPIKGADWAIPIQGDSMAPEYYPGSIALIKKVNEKAFLEWGKAYVLDTINGTVIKYIYPTNAEGKFKCVSLNEKYPPFEVDLTDIHGVYKILACVSFK